MKIVAAIIGSALLAAACSDKPPANPSTATMAGESTVGTTAPPPPSTPTTPSSPSTTLSSQDTTPPYAETEHQIGTDTTSSSMTDTSRNAKSTPYATTGVADSAPQASDTTTTTKKADNTAQNARDRHDTVTPGDQGNSKDEVKITASIRKQLVASKMSFNAKNAKVITTGTKVTLRGPVKTDEEKAQIEALARGTAGVTEVDNQLEVKK